MANGYTKNDRRGGFYFIEGKPYVSVTRVLEILDKPALRYWFGKEVYLAMVKDPTLSEQTALAKPYEKSDAAKNRGTTVHSIVESWKQTGGVVDNEQYKGYANAFKSWIEDNHITLKEHERTVVSRRYGYAGTLDLLVGVNGSGKTWIIDIKTGKDIYPEAFLQLSAYKQALAEEGVLVDQIAVLLLQENGTYKFAQGEDQIDEFLACQKLWLWKNKDLVEKVSN